ncbi:deaminase AmnE, partial [Pseudomonas syringae pv. actinidiae ICMP 19071]
MSDSIQRTSVGDFPISQTVTVPASASLIFISGTLPDLADPHAPAGTPAAYGNTELQTVSVFNKLRRILQQQDLDLGDIVQLRVFLVGAEETGGKLDFAGLQAGYTQFFWHNRAAPETCAHGAAGGGVAIAGGADRSGSGSGQISLIQRCRQVDHRRPARVLASTHT